MLVTRIAIAAVIAWVFSFGGTSAAPLEAYGRLPSIETVSISPDGQKLGLILTDGEDRQILIRDLKSGDNKLLRAGRTKVRYLDWAGSNFLLINSSFTAVVADVIAPRQEYLMTQVYDLTKGTLRDLGKDFEESLNVSAGQPVAREVDGKIWVFLEGIHFVSDSGQDSMYRIDPETGRSTLLDAGRANTNDWLVGNDGRPLAQTEYDEVKGRWTLKVAKSPGWTVVKTTDTFPDRPELQGFGRDGKSVLISSSEGDGTVYREIDAENPVWPEPFRKGLYQEPIHDVASHRLIGFESVTDDGKRYDFLEPADTKAWQKVERAYKGQAVDLVSWTSDRSRLVVLVHSVMEGPSYVLVDLKAGETYPIGNVFAKLGVGDVSVKKIIRFKAKDGLDLSGYLTLPNNREPTNLPLIVLAHGGPAARDDNGFDWWSQALAARGYAVLQVNFRGSDGFGPAFLKAGYGQWGRKMQTDLSDGVRYLVGSGIVDPKRVCIAGASYGGYAALAGATFDDGVYRCAASVAGPSDLRRMVAWSKGHTGVAAQRYWTNFMGADAPNDPVLGTISPALHVEAITIPILLVHGKDDTVVPLDQSLTMQRALKAAGKPVETVIMPGEDHWLSRGETRLQMLQSVVAFLEKHNPPQ